MLHNYNYDIVVLPASLCQGDSTKHCIRTSAEMPWSLVPHADHLRKTLFCFPGLGLASETKLVERGCTFFCIIIYNYRLNKDLVVKIGDFGLARDIDCDNYYRIGTQRPLPVKWMALESLRLQYFNVKTDVVSSGYQLLQHTHSLVLCDYTCV